MQKKPQKNLGHNSTWHILVTNDMEDESVLMSQISSDVTNKLPAILFSIVKVFINRTVFVSGTHFNNNFSIAISMRWKLPSSKF